MSETSRGKLVASSGITGLDEILGGGFPRRRLSLIRGNPGSGKTTLALQFLLAGMQSGEGGLYISLSESDEEITEVARSHGWNLEGLARITLDTVDELISGDARTTVFHPSEVELDAVAELIGHTAERARPARVVFDSLSEFRLLSETSIRYRHQLLELKRRFAAMDATMLCVDDMNPMLGVQDPHVLSLAHGVVSLTHLEPEYGLPRRRLQVAKLRGVRPKEGYHDFTIHTGGLSVYPRLAGGGPPTTFEHSPVSSGNERLDALLGGGIDRGTTTLVMGAAGTGKSSLALMYANRMAARGERVVFYTFDESLSIALARARALGMDLQEHLDSGRILADQVDPAELSPGEFADTIRRRIADGATMLVIDSLNGYLNAMPGERYLLHHLHELSAYLNHRGVASLWLLTMHGVLQESNTSVDLSYLADMVISLRFFETAGEVRKAIAVIKKRSGPHENTIRELRISSGSGLELGPQLTEFSGVLSGIPEFHGRQTDMLGS